MNKDDFKGYGYSSRIKGLNDASVLKKINISKLIKFGVVNYEDSYAGEDGYFRNGKSLVALKWYNAYLSDGQLLLIDRTGYSSDFSLGDCSQIGPSKEYTPLDFSCVTSKGMNINVYGNPFEYTIMDLKSGDIQTLDMRDYSNQDGLIIPTKEEDQLTETEKVLHSRIKNVENKAIEKFQVVKDAEDYEKKNHPIKFLFNKLFKKENKTALPKEESIQYIQQIESAIDKLGTTYREQFRARVQYENNSDNKKDSQIDLYKDNGIQDRYETQNKEER